MSPILIAIIFVICGYILSKLFQFATDLKRIAEIGLKIPHPPITGYFLGNIDMVPKDIHKMGRFFVELTNKFAPEHEVFGFWMAHILKITPVTGKAVKDILDSNEEITKGNDYDIIIPWLGTGLLISTGEKWRTRRKMLTPMFHFKMLDNYLETFNRESKVFTEILEPYADGKRTVDFFPYIKRCALDIICDTAMGIQLGCQLDGKNEYACAVDEIARVTLIYSMNPIYWFGPIWWLSSSYRRYNALLKILTDFTKSVIRERQEEFKLEGKSRGKEAFLDSLLAMKEANNLSDEDIREEVDTFMFEGHDTTATGVAWTLWCLATHPEIQEDVYKELYEVFGDSDRDMTTEDMSKLHLFDRVLKESMRINPPVPFVSRDLKNDLSIGGYVAPKGSQMLISPYLIHRNETIYPNHMKFDPNRFLPENIRKRHAYDYIPFSAGPRNCIGQKFAIYEEKIMVSWILRRYKLSSKMKFEDNGETPEMILRPTNGIPLEFTRRDL